LGVGIGGRFIWAREFTPVKRAIKTRVAVGVTLRMAHLFAP
jgi:hypothetical protein